MDISHMLIETLDVLRPTPTPDGAGRYLNLFSKVASFPARVSGLNQGERARAGRGELSYSDVVYFAGGRDVQRGDQLVNRKTGAEYLVTGVRTLSLSSHMEVEVRHAARGDGVGELPGE